MKESLVVILFTMLCTLGVAQSTVTKYFNSRRFDDEVSAERAKYSRTIVTEKDGTVTTTDRALKNNEVIGRYAHRGDEPMGVWVTERPSGGYYELDYDFTVTYDETPCPDDGVSEKISKFFENDASLNYTAPTFNDYESFSSLISRNLRYPAKPRREGIEGTVFARFTITKEGNVEDIVVTKGVHITLDKEAIRVLRKIKLNTPAKVNGEPTAICVEVPLKFKLA
jgi:TonB family protein